MINKKNKPANIIQDFSKKINVFRALKLKKFKKENDENAKSLDCAYNNGRFVNMKKNNENNENYESFNKNDENHNVYLDENYKYDENHKASKRDKTDKTDKTNKTKLNFKINGVNKNVALLVSLCFTIFLTSIFMVNDFNSLQKVEVASTNTVYKMGSRGEMVKSIQRVLKKSTAYTGNIDGIFGYNTYLAVRKYQSWVGLTVDGIVGNATLKAMGLSNTQSSSSSLSSNGNLYLLACAVYGESRGEPYTGQVAVAAVVLNRVRSSKFPNTVAGVIYEPGAFTCVSDGQINLTPNQTAYNAARDALNGWDPTGGCIYYWNPVTATSKWIWNLKIVTTIGKHHFAKGGY